MFLRISIVGPVYPLRGGIAQYTSILYLELKKKGHDVQIINFKRQYPKFLFPGKTQNETSEEPIKVDSHIILDSINPWTWLRAYRIIKRHRSDLVIFKYWMPFFAPCFGVIARLTSRFSKAKTLFICDNILPHEKRFGDVTLTRFALKPVDYFITQSDTVRKDLLSLKPHAVYKNAPHPLYNIFGEIRDKITAKKLLGIDKPDYTKTLLFFGFIRKYKGLDLLIRTMPLVLKKMKIKLLVVGEFYGDEDYYRGLIKELDLENVVDVHADYCPNEKVGLFFSGCDAVVLPYISATQSGIVPIAYYFNKPVIATDVGGLAEVVIHQKTGFIVPPSDPAALAQSIIRYYDEKCEDTFSRNIETEKKKYSWESFVEAIETLTREIV